MVYPVRENVARFSGFREPWNGKRYSMPNPGLGRLDKTRTGYVWANYVGPLYHSFMHGGVGSVRQFVSFVDGAWVLGDFGEKKTEALIPGAARDGTGVNLKLSWATWRETFGGVRRALRYLDTPEKMVDWYCELIGLDSQWLRDLLDVPVCIAVPFFSKVKLLMHAHTDELPMEWRFFVDLQLLAGYPDHKLREMADDPVLWLSSPVKSEYDDEWWRGQFAVTYAFAVSRSPGLILTLEEYTKARWLWVTPGSSSFSKLMLGDKLVRTKLGAALSLSDEELLGMVASIQQPPEDQMIGVFLKGDEKGFKRRLIANVPLGAYIVASYVRYCLDQYTGPSPNFSKLSVGPQDEMDVVELLRAGRLAMPLDESGFEYHVSRESWLGFFAFARPIVGPAIDLLHSYFDTAYWQWDGKRGKWVSGMPSGLALTSYLNSWMNYIKQKALIDSDIHWAAGDDVLAFPTRPTSLEDVAKKYAAFGSEVNESKNWLSYVCAEYLKVIYYVGGSTGYPARIYSSLLWATDVRFSRPDVKLGELAELFKQFYDRVGLPLDTSVVCADLSRAMSQKVAGFSASVARDWLHAPKLHGGFGRLPNVNVSFTWDVVVLRNEMYVGARIRMPTVPVYGPADQKTYKFVVQKFELPGGGSESYRLGPPLHMAPITSMTEWEDRLNGRDERVKGPFSKMAYDPIPLPTIDFISTGNMAALAKRNGFNVFPNMSGSWRQISSRLLKASWALAGVAVEWCRRYNLEVWA